MLLLAKMAAGQQQTINQSIKFRQRSYSSLFRAMQWTDSYGCLLLMSLWTVIHPSKPAMVSNKQHQPHGQMQTPTLTEGRGTDANSYLRFFQLQCLEWRQVSTGREFKFSRGS